MKSLFSLSAPSEAEAIDVGTFEVYEEVRVCKFQQGETGLIANSSEKVGRVKKFVNSSKMRLRLA